MKASRVQVTTAVTMIVGGRAGDTTRALAGDVAYPAAAVIRGPAGGQTVYLGGVAVDATDGFPLAAGETVEVDLVGEILYGMTSTTSQYVYVLRRGD